jgi:hypothetical protein
MRFVHWNVLPISTLQISSFLPPVSCAHVSMMNESGAVCAVCALCGDGTAAVAHGHLGVGREVDAAAPVPSVGGVTHVLALALARHQQTLVQDALDVLLCDTQTAEGPRLVSSAARASVVKGPERTSAVPW